MSALKPQVSTMYLFSTCIARCFLLFFLFVPCVHHIYNTLASNGNAVHLRRHSQESEEHIGVQSYFLQQLSILDTE